MSKQCPSCSEKYYRLFKCNECGTQYCNKCADPKFIILGFTSACPECGSDDYEVISTDEEGESNDVDPISEETDSSVQDESTDESQGSSWDDSDSLTTDSGSWSNDASGGASSARGSPSSAYGAYEKLAAMSVGGLLGIVIGFVPIWLLSPALAILSDHGIGGCIGWVFSFVMDQGLAGKPNIISYNPQTGRHWFLGLTFAASVIGSVSALQGDGIQNWVASPTGDPAKTRFRGLLAIVPSLAAIFLLATYWMGAAGDDGHPGSVGSEPQVASSAFSITSEVIAEGVQDGQPVNPTVMFREPASAVLFVAYANAIANRDRLRVSVWSQGREITSCPEIVLGSQSANYYCSITDLLLGYGNYYFRADVNGRALGAYPFTVKSRTAD